MNNKKAIWVSLVLCLFLFVFFALLTGCENPSIREAKEFYIAFREKWDESYIDARPYIYTEHPELDEISIQSFIKTVDYKIINIDEVNPKLTAFTVDYLLEGETEYRTAYHFVGWINGKQFVMLAAREVPADLQENLDVDDYTYPDSMRPDDVDILS